ncbi:dihydrofolate reductase-like domain-containing protein [Xylaria sp. FL0064]|nr:dihydrofolate reductase-like domain-containing protein [Xylaria sp. FL0064]
MAEAPLYFPAAERQRLEPHIPPSSSSSHPMTATHSPSPQASHPFVTLTFATSLDSALALGPGIRTALSGPQSKAMTHYLRSRHDAICVGVGTAIADDPGLNSRLDAAVEQCSGDGDGDGDGDDDDNGRKMTGETVDESGSGGSGVTTHQPRPIIIDPRLRWDFTGHSKVMRLAREGKGLAPYIVTLEKEPPPDKREILEDAGGKFIVLNPERDGEGKTDRLDWRTILAAVRQESLRSIMIEGGGEVINSLLSEEASLVDSVIVTIAPIWLGRGGVTVSPPRTNIDRPAARLCDTTWMPLGDDIVLCGRIAR